jgi:hypothetical protein
MSTQQSYIAEILLSHNRESYIVKSAEGYSAEYGGDLPVALVQWLRARGAQILRYVQRGVVSTVVSF